ncbi:MAG: CDP-diacylglycerol--serine O-phosphatidyltransferase [Defluviitaleaceae bacterium]|nr:CDP-diacylglycerol--serine O-phosphatidyltransferase [Defluviitaleaceae bacterium]
MKKLIPNMLTLTNIMMGAFSLLFLVQDAHLHKHIIIPIMISIGATCDYFDGRLARKFDAVSEMGKQMDSFADIITFGIAPVMLLNHLIAYGHSPIMIVASLLYIIAGIYRLARFNVSTAKGYFMGLPIPPAGVVLAGYCFLYPFWYSLVSREVSLAISAVLLVLLAFLMVSTKKIKRRGVQS